MESENDVALFMSDKRLVERWEEALQRCRQKLKPSEYHAVSQYDTPQKLLVGLEKLQAEHLISTDGISRLIAQIYPTSQSFRDTVTLFVGLMLPRTIATGFLWGVFYLIIKVGNSEFVCKANPFDLPTGPLAFSRARCNIEKSRKYAH